MNARAVGARAEDAACAFLEANGYAILGRNLRLEVKYRRGARFGTPAEAVTPLKMRRILDAATCYAAQNGLLETKLRFDVIELFDGKIRHIEGAFDQSDCL